MSTNYKKLNLDIDNVQGSIRLFIPSNLDIDPIGFDTRRKKSHTRSYWSKTRIIKFLLSIPEIKKEYTL